MRHSSPPTLEVVQLSEQLETLRFRVFSPTGLNIAAQGKAKRRPGYATARNAHCPEGAEQTVPTHTSDPNEFCPFRAISRWRTQYPGRRCALPWANMLLPHSGRIAKAQREASSLSVFQCDRLEAYPTN